MIKRPLQKADTTAAISEVDRRLRECLQVLRLALPADRRDIEEVESQYRRLVDRAIRDFKEDLELFPPEQK